VAVEVIRADVSGFCSGVNRALQIAEESVQLGGAGATYTLGDLVHNGLVMERLGEKGIKPIRSVTEVTSGTVIIRAHGATPEDLKYLRDHGIAIVDATCPKVSRSHGIIEEHGADGCHVIVAGERDHSEVRGLVARARRVTVVETAGEAEEILCTPNMMLIAQTTFSPTEFGKIGQVLERRCGEIRVFSTICPAMERRHKALADLAAKVDAIVVVGGRESANTRRLFENAIETGKPSWHIEQGKDLPRIALEYSRVGLTAGASTPDWVIDEVERRLVGGGAQ
jgi:(E)-4-hydroxy-3-methyl-but-2-enyl pyrophosphate reductase